MKIPDRFIYDTNGDPFHLAGTRIYWDPDGTLMYNCPHCGRRPVPRHRVAELAHYAD